MVSFDDATDTTTLIIPGFLMLDYLNDRFSFQIDDANTEPDFSDGEVIVGIEEDNGQISEMSVEFEMEIDDEVYSFQFVFSIISVNTPIEFPDDLHTFELVTMGSR